MQLALRRAYGFGGLGFCDPTTDPTCTSGVAESINTDPVPASDPLLTDESGNFCLASMFVNGQCPQSVQPPIGSPVVVSSPIGSSLTCPDGSPRFSDGTCTETSSTPGITPGAVTAAAQIAAALTRALNPTSGIFGGAPTSCPTGYVYGAPGQSVTIAPGVATVGTGKCLPSTVPTGIVPGVSNTTLGIAVVAVLFLFMMGKKR